MKISEFCLLNGTSLKKNEGEGGYLYLDTANITNGVVDSFQKYSSYADLPSRARRKVANNSIVYSTVRPNQQHFGIITNPPDNLIVSTGFCVIDVDEKIANPRYVYYYLSQDSITKKLHAIAEQATTAYPSIKAKDLGDLEIELPDLDRQNEVAKILSSLDEKIVLNSAINDNLFAQAKLLFDNEIANVSSIPSEWKKGTLLDIATYTNGLAMQRFRPADDEIGIPVLKIKELRQGFCDSASELCSTHINEEYLISDGDVIFSWSGSLLIDLWGGDICGLNQHLFKLTSSEYPKWFYYLWTLHHLDRFITIAADKATTMGHIKRGDLAQAEVIIPSNDDINRIGAAISPIVNLIIANKVESRKMAALRDKMLIKLITNAQNQS